MSTVAQFRRRSRLDGIATREGKMNQLLHAVAATVRALCAPKCGCGSRTTTEEVTDGYGYRAGEIRCYHCRGLIEAYGKVI